MLLAVFIACSPEVTPPPLDALRWEAERNARLLATPHLNPERFEEQQRVRIEGCPARPDLDPPRPPPPHPRPEARQKAKVAEGSTALPADHVQVVVRGNKGRIETCVQNALMQDPCTAGRVGVSWSIAAGKVTDYALTQNTTGNAELGGCVIKAVRSMRFDPEYSGVVEEYAWVIQGQ